MEKRGLRMFQFGRNLLHPRGIDRSVKDADSGRVPAKREPGKGIDNVQLTSSMKGDWYPADKVSGGENMQALSDERS